MSGARFEDLEVWRRTRTLTASVYALTRDGALFSDQVLCRQMRRSAVSVMSNISEGYERGGNRELINFLSMAKGSAGELRSQIYIAQDAGLLDTQRAGHLRNECVEISRMLAGFIRYLQSGRYKGHKFRIQQSHL
ncbi:four helix bundle protein [Thioalkalivibrio sulfidiphilus]|uniref:S23 ribosomal protein n=1 Tax=Thioalkalivibrio sulfidiphilus (strain HL-EbGR7) TaxID=396588 RepID=B8GN39_THISH|nr:four helix bundle protein [Thioalkalivibrio sulfidiphilus]ACL71900.1 S23 ribosomal protein [Thioalkalivibrio sulfidiphilus HL-EbGr7]